MKREIACPYDRGEFVPLRAGRKTCPRCGARIVIETDRLLDVPRDVVYDTSTHEIREVKK